MPGSLEATKAMVERYCVLCVVCCVLCCVVCVPNIFLSYVI
jgi:hypothetical protein